MKRHIATIGAAPALLLVGIAIGRSTAPAEVKHTETSTTATATQTHATEHVSEAPVRIVTRRILVPCPPVPGATPAEKTIEETTTERGPVLTTRTTETKAATASASASSTTTKSQPRLMLGATAEARLRDILRLQPVYGGEAKYRFAGPFWVGAGVNSRGEFRASLAVTF